MDEEETPGSEPQVTVRNTLRRPLTFRVGGQTIRLSPGEAVALDESLLPSSELQHFCSRGVVTVMRPEGDEEADDARADAADDAGDDEESASSRAKPRRSKEVRTSRSTGKSS